MKLFAIDRLEILNHALWITMQDAKTLIMSGAFSFICVSETDIESNVNKLLNDLQAKAYRKNYKLLIIDSGTIYSHEFSPRDIDADSTLAMNCTVPAELRKFWDDYNCKLPNNLVVSKLLTKTSLKSIKYDNIFTVSLNLDFKSTIIALNNVSPMTVLYLNLCDELEISGSYKVLMSSFDFYNSKYGKPCAFVSDEQTMSSIDCKADLALREII